MNRRTFLGVAASALSTGELARAEAQPADARAFHFDLFGTTFSFEQYDRQLRQTFVLPTDRYAEAARHLAYSGDHNAALADTAAAAYDPLTVETALHCTGEDVVDHHGMKIGAGQPGLRLVYRGRKESAFEGGRRMVLELQDPALKLRARSMYDAFPDARVVRRFTEVTNEGSSPVGIEYVSSAMLANFAAVGTFEQDLKIHICLNSWQAEGQWHASRPSELGFVQNGEFSVSAAFLTSLGTWSSERYLPMGMIENTALGLTWFWQIEYNGSWHTEISQTSAKNLYAYFGGPDEQHASAWKNLQPGETYRTVPVAIGCVAGGFEEAVGELTRYRRSVLAAANQKRDSSCAVIFNDANSLDLDPTTAKEMPLIGAAAAAGCEIYVIDAGWYAEINESWWGTVGSWEPAKTRWPGGGLKAVFDQVRARGMKAGIWLEPEVAGLHSVLAGKPDEWFFVRHGRRVIDHDRYLLDFRNPEVCAYLDNVVARLVDELGIRYIKLDYNVDGLAGTELRADSFGQGLHEHNLALIRWLQGLMRRYPQLVIENCASGGGRIDYAMLSVLQLESASDQDDYRRYPSIVTGLSAGLLPEQLGVWAFPGAHATPDEASFHMVNAMLCRIHQSGALATCSPDVTRQVKQGIAVYKNVIRKHVPVSVPFYPLGMPDMTDRLRPVALGMRSPGAEFIAVWRLSGDGKVTLPIAAGLYRLLYPTDLEIAVANVPGRVSVHFPRTDMACILTKEF